MQRRDRRAVHVALSRIALAPKPEPPSRIELACRLLDPIRSLRQGITTMSILTWIGAGISLAIFVYLFIALLYPERLS